MLQTELLNSSNLIESLRTIQITNDKFYHVMFTAVIKKENMKMKILSCLENLMTSVLKHSEGSPLHFIVMTDESSEKDIRNSIQTSIQKVLSEKIIRSHGLTKKFPLLRIEFVNLDFLASKYSRDINIMKQFFSQPISKYEEDGVREVNGQLIKMVSTEKYSYDSFYTAPFLHREIPQEIKRLCVIDIDLEFRIDFKMLFDHFLKFTTSEILGIAQDLNPHYFLNTIAYRKKHPESGIGLPGRFQGFNSGVALFDLQKMRESQLYNNETQLINMADLADEFEYDGFVGDQDWLTMLGWKHPDLFYMLPCQFNYQNINKCYAENKEETKLCDIFTFCDIRHSPIKILHRNSEIL